MNLGRDRKGTDLRQDRGQSDNSGDSLRTLDMLPCGLGLTQGLLHSRQPRKHMSDQLAPRVIISGKPRQSRTQSVVERRAHLKNSLTKQISLHAFVVAPQLNVTPPMITLQNFIAKKFPFSVSPGSKQFTTDDRVSVPYVTAARLPTSSVTTPGSANVDVSPSASVSLAAILRRIRRMILPDRVFGSAGAH